MSLHKQLTTAGSRKRPGCFALSLNTLAPAKSASPVHLATLVMQGSQVGGERLNIRFVELLPKRGHLAFNAGGYHLVNPGVTLVQVI